MVNVKSGTSTRARVIDMLRNTPAGISGETIADRLGLSRVAVWKAIQSLNAAGYGITPTTAGYVLAEEPADSIMPWEFGAAESRFLYWEETDSTMNRARELALGGASSGMVVMAERQSAGRGTGTHVWESARGGLLFTLITRPSINQAWSHIPVLAAQCALSRASATSGSTRLLPSWPNDMIAPVEAACAGTDGGGKAAGILCEYLSSGNTVQFMNIGVGINTGTRPAAANAASVEVPRKALLEAFLGEFARSSAFFQDTVAEWNALCPNTGKRISFCALGAEGQPEGSVRSGTFLGVDRAGWAQVRENESSETSGFPPGSITILNKGMNA